jgi:hypothetical protein
MDPNLIVNAALAALNEILTLLKHVRSQSGLTDEQLAAQAEAQDLQNLEDIKKLLTL